jgi:hypothetical protein
VLNQQIEFSRLDGGPEDLDGISDGVLSLDTLYIVPGGMLVLDTDSATVDVMGDVVLNSGLIQPLRNGPQGEGPSLFLRSGRTITLRGNSRIAVDGATLGGAVTLCSEDSILVQGSSAITANVPDTGLSAGSITLRAEQTIEVGKNGAVLANGPFGGRVRLTSCSTSRAAIALASGAVEARGFRLNGGGILIEAVAGGVLSPEAPSLPFVVATGKTANGEIVVLTLNSTSLPSEVFDPPALINLGPTPVQQCECALPERILEVDPPVSPTISLAIALTGRSERPNAMILVESDGGTIMTQAAADRSFHALVHLVPNRVNDVFVREVEPSGELGAVVAVSVIQDMEPPSVFIDFPLPDADLTGTTTDVAGRVGDRLSGFEGLQVVVNGITAAVDIGIGNNGTFFVSDVPVTPNVPTILQATAMDVLGNTNVAEVTVLVTPVSVDQPALVAIGGNEQSAPVETPVAQALEVLVTNADGTPFDNKLVQFLVTRSNGLLSDLPAGDAVRLLQVRTDGAGIARAYWTLGSDAGCGNNRVEATSAGVGGTAFFCATALPGAATQINVGSGNSQRVQIGSPAPEALRVWVNDSCNGVAGVPVVFSVVGGGGSFGGQSTVTAVTGPTGHAEAEFTMGPQEGNQLVEAGFPGGLTMPATFVLFGVEPDEQAETSVDGAILDNSNQPVTGARCVLAIGGVSYGPIFSDDQGKFRFSSVQESGPAHLEVDGQFATAVGGIPIPQGSYPALGFELVVIAHADNELPMPVLLPALDPANSRSYDGTTDVELTVQGLEGLVMIVKAGSMRRGDGSQPSPGDPAILSLNRVNHDDIPMPMPDGVAPPLAWTLQPAGATFDPPVEIRYPNVSGLPAGAVAYFLSFDHDTNRFEIVASGTVDEDGAEIVTDPGVGLTEAGWGCNCPPYAITGECKDCDLSPNGCGPEGGVEIGGIEIDIPCSPLPGCSFMPACNNHDDCYSSCGANKLVCDLFFLAEMLLKCQSCFSSVNPLQDVCEAIAWIYAAAVAIKGDDAYSSAQMKACWCEASQATASTDDFLDRYRELAFSGWQVGGEEFPPPPFIDADLDLLPDDWEAMVGLDPMNPDDAVADNDVDGLINLREFFHQFDPFLADTDGDGIDDLMEAEGFQDPPPMVLDDTWTVTINGQTVAVDDSGFFSVPNVSAVDRFGAAGPGSAPDFVSDDFLRLIGTGEVGGQPMYAFSDPFLLGQGEIFAVPTLTLTTVPPPMPESLRIETPQAVLLPGEMAQLSVLGTLVDDSELDLTLRADWTTYRSSNSSIAAVSNDGLVTAGSTGVAFVSATNDGAFASLRVVVTLATVTTTVEGSVLDGATNDPVVGADVSLVGFPDATVSGSGGVFVIPDVLLPSDQETLTVQASATVGGSPLFGLVSADVVPGGVTDVGAIHLQFAPRLLIIGAESVSRIPTSEFLATGFFETVDCLESSLVTPSLGLLDSYDVVLNYTNFPPANPVGLGDVLADYVDGGGRLVLCTYSFSSPWAVQGRIMTPSYAPLINVNANGTPVAPIIPILPTDAVLANVDLATMIFFRNNNFARPTLDPGVVLIATDSIGTNMIARNVTGNVVGLNFFPSLAFGNGPQLYQLMTSALFSVLGAQVPSAPLVLYPRSADRTGALPEEDASPLGSPAAGE